FEQGWVKGVIGTDLHAFCTPYAPFEELAFGHRARWTDDFGRVGLVRPVRDASRRNQQSPCRSAGNGSAALEVRTVLNASEREKPSEFDDVLGARNLTIVSKMALVLPMLPTALRAVSPMTTGQKQVADRTLQVVFLDPEDG